MPRTSFKFAIALIAAASLGACATLSPVSRIERRLVSLGFSDAGAACVSDELDRKLDRKQLMNVADFLDRIDRPDRAGGAGVIEALKQMDDPSAVAGVVGAALTCAIRG